MNKENFYEQFEGIDTKNAYFYGKNEDIEIIFDGRGVYSPFYTKQFIELFNGEFLYKPGYNIYPSPYGADFETTLIRQNFLKIIQNKLLVDKLFIPNFKHIGPKIYQIDLNKIVYNSGNFNPDVGYGDGVIVIKNQNKEEKIAVGGFVGDCAAVVFHYKKDIIGILHAGRPGTSKGVVETMIQQLSDILGDKGSGKSLQEVKFYVSPMAGEDFELPLNLVKNRFKSFLKNNKISLKNIFKPNPDKPGFGYLNLRKAIKIALENKGINTEKQVYFYPEDTTNPVNGWPSYRLYNKGIYPWNDRLAAFGIIE